MEAKPAVQIVADVNEARDIILSLEASAEYSREQAKEDRAEASALSQKGDDIDGEVCLNRARNREAVAERRQALASSIDRARGVGA